MCEVILLKSFCGYKLETGSFCILFTELVFQIIRIIIIYRRNYDSVFELSWIFLIISIMAVAVYGVKEEKSVALLLYIAAHSIDLILYGYFGYWAIENTSTSFSWSTINLGLFYISSFVIAFFAFAVIYSYYVEMLEGDSIRTFMLREV